MSAQSRIRRRRADWRALIWVLPALAVYAAFVLFPLLQSVQYSFYNWDGIGVATWAGLSNWESLFTNPELLQAIGNAFVLIVFYTVVPIFLGLIAAALIRQVRPGPFGTITRVALFVPQVIPLVAAGIAWSWLYSQTGLVNQFLGWIGLGGATRAWLGDFTFALPAVGVIGIWVMLGFCTVLLLSGMGRIDPSLYEAARLDGAGSFAEFFAVTLPGLRQEIVVCVTFTMIAALTSFDIIQVSTQGGPGYQTLVPGVAVYRLAFLDQHLGQASALAIFLTLLVLAIIIPIQRLRRVR
ncbi:MAG TPA: sugar ABC transporter permease [Galbitalea sp.]|nr:sugar ABC transporter permease [Galbitalea sp.]